MYQKRDQINTLLAGFKNWIIALNYDKSSWENDPKRVAEFLEWLLLHQPGVLGLPALTIGSQIIEHFFEHLAQRPNKRFDGGLSAATLRNYQKSLRRFSRYLLQMAKGELDMTMVLVTEEAENLAKLQEKTFSSEEIKKLYAATFDNSIGQRDRVMLGMYYGCGLRRSEGASLQIGDILSDKSLLYVRKGKQGKPRYVPIVNGLKKDLKIYLQQGRKSLLKDQVHRHLFISKHAKPMTGNSLYDRFKYLQKRANIEPRRGLHSLRHSIATHLLQQGMPLAYIARFLGHASLESTQIYTHINPKK